MSEARREVVETSWLAEGGLVIIVVVIDSETSSRALGSTVVVRGVEDRATPLLVLITREQAERGTSGWSRSTSVCIQGGKCRPQASGLGTLSLDLDLIVVIVLGVVS
jgi:hypothetical protein